MTLQGWIFMVGLRVFDVGALIAWLVWFFKLRAEDEDDDPRDGDDRRDGGTEPPKPPDPKGPPELELPKPDAEPWPHRRRDHGGDRPAVTRPVRRVPERAPRRTPVR